MLLMCQCVYVFVAIVVQYCSIVQSKVYTFHSRKRIHTSHTHTHTQIRVARNVTKCSQQTKREKEKKITEKDNYVLVNEVETNKSCAKWLEITQIKTATTRENLL